MRRSREAGIEDVDRFQGMLKTRNVHRATRNMQHGHPAQIKHDLKSAITEYYSDSYNNTAIYGLSSFFKSDKKGEQAGDDEKSEHGGKCQAAENDTSKPSV